MDAQTSAESARCGVMLIGFGLGSPFVCLGMAIRLGYTKRYFLVRGPAPFFGPANYHFLLLAGAVLCVLGAIALPPADVETRQDLLGHVFVPCFILAFVVGFWQPWWLKPKWIRQLKQNHPDIYPFLREAAQEEVGTDRDKIREWERKMDTVEGQNEWVAEVRKRLGMPDPRTSEGVGNK
jgi:hypothetical protein